MKRKFVDLITKDSELDSLILEEYPGRILEGQHKREGERKDRTYWFYDLGRAEIERFLEEREYSFEYSEGVLKVA